MSEKQVNKNPDGMRLILLILTIFTWFIGAILYLIMIKPKGLELIVCVLALFIPVIPGILLFLNAFGVLKL